MATTKRYDCMHPRCEVGGWTTYSKDYDHENACPVCHRPGRLREFYGAEIMRSEQVETAPTHDPATYVCTANTDWTKVNTIWDAFAL